MKRADGVWIAILLALAALITVLAYGRALDPIIDTGRDLYIPEQIRDGLKLYRDILYYYPPLAPYLLALITAVTGSSLAAYTAIGTMIALATAAAIYAIGRSAGSVHSAGAASLLFFTCSVYSISGRTSNYFFPYAHAATLAMLFLLGGSAFLIGWVYGTKRRSLLLAGLFFMLCASWTKLEYIVFSSVIIALVAVVHQIPARWLYGYVVAAAGSFVAVDRFFAGAPEHRHWLFDNVLASSLLHGATARHFYRQVSGFDAIGTNLLLAGLGAAAVASIVLAIRWSPRNVGLAAVAIAVIAFLASGLLFRGWAVLQLALIPFALRRRRDPLLILLALSLCGSSRIFLRMVPEWYGFVFLVPVYILIAFVLLDWLPEMGVYSRSAARLALIPIVVVAGQYLWKEARILRQKNVPVQTGRGVFYEANVARAGVLDAFLTRMKQLGRPTLVVVPEGLTLNYLAQSKTPISFHTFTPVEAADPEIEMQIIQDLSTHPPEYIAIVTRDLTDFGYRGFGLDYDQKLGSVIREHYKLVQRWRLPGFELILMKMSE